MPCIQIEVLYQTKQEMSIVSHNSIARLVLDWMKRQLNTEELTMDNLMERSHLLYLAMDNSLQDCCDLPMGHESETELVQDYKRLVLKCPNNKARRKCLAQTTRPRVLIYSRDISFFSYYVRIYNCFSYFFLSFSSSSSFRGFKINGNWCCDLEDIYNFWFFSFSLVYWTLWIYLCTYTTQYQHKLIRNAQQELMINCVRIEC